MSNETVFNFNVPSVYDGEVPFLTFYVNQEPTGTPVVIGKLLATGGVLSFEGNADESAKMFFEKVIMLNREYIERSNKVAPADKAE